MIHKNDLLAFNFYKKEKFTGSCRGMRYQIERTENDEKQLFCVTTWPGPYNFESTGKDLKTQKIFPFEEASLNEITEYLNQTYEASKSEWPLGI